MKSLQILLETFATYLRSMLDSYDLNRVVLRDRWQTQGHDQLKERDDDVAQFSLAQGNEDEIAPLELVRPTLTMADVGVQEGSRAGLSTQLKNVSSVLHLSFQRGKASCLALAARSTPSLPLRVPFPSPFPSFFAIPGKSLPSPLSTFLSIGYTALKSTTHNPTQPYRLALFTSINGSPFPLQNTRGS